jgi:phosphocarrier protein FPr
MVGIVIVSHSAQLAAGVHELVTQMVQDRVPIAVAGGLDDPENPIGTDPMRVLEAIEAAYSEDGVVVLMDLGSALLSAEMALEFLSPEQQANVHLCPAPLVEGAMAAAVQASLGSSVADVMREARSALGVKETQLGVEAGPPPAEISTAAQAEQARTITITIMNRQGLHARPAAQFVRTAGGFDADVIVRKGERPANARSINQIATLGVRQRDTVAISASGPEADAALAALKALIEANFGETDDAEADLPQPAAPAPVVSAGDADHWQGIPVSPGIALGRVAHFQSQLPAINHDTVTDPQAERNRLRGAIHAAIGELESVLAAASARLGAEQATILEAHIVILQDPTLIEAVEQHIGEERLNAAAAWQSETELLADSYRALDDPYMQARAADIQDVSRRVLRQLLSGAAPALDFAEPVVLVASDLLPSDTASLDVSQVLGICTAAGGATSHSAILARALGIPAVAGLGAALLNLAEGQLVALDGEQGLLWPHPTQEERATLEERRRKWRAAQESLKQAGARPAQTLDGHHIAVWANIGRPAEVGPAVEYGAEGVGLFRTEFLFLDRPAAPDEDEQFAAYREAAQSLGDRPLIIRTLDIGGDKPIRYLEQPREDNPFLGLRGIRYCLHYPALFKTQLRAILRASADHDIRLMFPMIGTPMELQAARAILQEVQRDLQAAGEPYNAALPVGIMIEVPSAVAVADRLARESAFFSIGTNDLTQYVMAADRGNAGVAQLADALQPAVLRMIAQTAAAAHSARIPVGMCGELAGNPLAAPLLIGLGLDELSMSAPAIPQVKAAVGAFTRAQAEAVAHQALQLDTAEAVAVYLKSVQADPSSMA